MSPIGATVIDPTHLELSAPLARQPGQVVLLTVVGDEDGDTERADCLSLSLQGLAAAYGPDEPEYSLADVREFNPDYVP